MTHRLYGECLNCEIPTCDGCKIVSDIVIKSMQKLGYKPVEENGGSTPSQYALPSKSLDLQDLIEYKEMSFAQANIFKACYRLGTKNNDLYEINKILWFANRLKNQAEQRQGGDDGEVI